MGGRKGRLRVHRTGGLALNHQVGYVPRRLAIGLPPVNHHGGYTGFSHESWGGSRYLEPMPSRPQPSYAELPPKLIGGLLCVDFVNTVRYRGLSGDDRQERLTSYEEFLHWSRRAEAVCEKDAPGLLAKARRRPDEAQRVLGQALELREVIARMLDGAARQRSTDLPFLNRLLDQAPARAELVPWEETYAWAAELSGRELNHPLWPILWSAADLLASERRKWVRRCADEECGWLFLDASPGSTRVWCSMQDCGNRAKARRHYQRAKAARRSS